MDEKREKDEQQAVTEGKEVYHFRKDQYDFKVEHFEESLSAVADSPSVQIGDSPVSGENTIISQSNGRSGFGFQVGYSGSVSSQY